MKRLLLVLALLVAIAMLMALVGIVYSIRAPGLGPARVLAWRLDAPLLDYAESPSLQLFGKRSPQGLAAAYRLLGRARRDEKIKGLGVYLQTTSFGYGKAQELRSLLESFAATGKFVDCYVETAGEGSNGTLAYYLASACQKISLSPLGELNVLGLYSDSPFVRGTLDKLRIEPQFQHVGAYKSAVEFYTERQHSAAAEEALGVVLDDLFAQLVEQIAASRRLTPQQVELAIDRAPLTAEQALAAGLIDEIGYPDLFDQRLRERAGGASRVVPLSEYRSAAPFFGRRRVAVIFVQGTIVRGWSSSDPWSRRRYVGAETLREILRHLREESDALGVVLRIDSPGGSAVASDLILREVDLLAAAKPVVVSMSDVAASGGYYISSKAAKIVAAPATITGSIGVFGGKLTTRHFQEELLGITHDTLSRGANADFYSALDPFSPAQAEQFEILMRRVYEVFVDHVVSGRGLSREAVEKAAGGRIWTGRQALELGLVDEIGGLDRAIEMILQARGLDADTPVELDFYPKPPSLVQLLAEGLSPFVDASRVDFLRLAGPRPPLALELPGEILRLFAP